MNELAEKIHRAAVVRAARRGGGVSSRWVWALGVLLGALLLAPSSVPPPRAHLAGKRPCLLRPTPSRPTHP